MKILRRKACQGKGVLFVISAPSGCGKTTLCKRLLAEERGLVHSISMTTRPPRPDEVNGIDYRFVSKKHFSELIKKKGFLEYEENFSHLYGTPKRFIKKRLKEGKHLLLSIDVKGAMKVRALYPKDSVLIFILPPSTKDLKHRLRLRMTDSSQTISARLKLAKKEMLYKNKYDYKIVNDRLDHAYRRLKNIMVKEILKRGRSEV